MEKEKENKKEKEMQITQWGIVLNVPNYILQEESKEKKELMLQRYENKIKNFGFNMCRKYAFIYHDKDKLEDESDKTPHYHLIAVLPHRVRKSTLLNYLQFYLEIEITLISAKPIKQLYLAIQYLTHMNDREKYQYNKIMIKGNFTARELKNYENGVCEKEINEELLIESIKVSETKSDLLMRIGIKAFRKYVQIINTLWYEYHVL